jgi:hypothetical protein
MLVQEVCAIVLKDSNLIVMTTTSEIHSNCLTSDDDDDDDPTVSLLQASLQAGQLHF